MRIRPGHILVNVGLLLGVLMVFVYVNFISSLSVPCMVRELSGEPDAGSGFTAAFDSFLRFNFNLGKNFKEFGLPVFLFFAGQVLLRVLMVTVYFLSRYRLKPYLAKIDILTSISVFLLAFLPVVNLF